MSLLQELEALGVNTDEAVERMNGNASLYERMLVKFKDMIKDMPVRPDFDGSNYADVIEAAHAIKGTSSNLSVTPIYEAYSEIVRLLRENQPEQAREILKKVIPVQTEIVNCIERHS